VPEMLLSLQDAELESNFAKRVAQSRTPILLSRQTNVHTSKEHRNHKFMMKNLIIECTRGVGFSCYKNPTIMNITFGPNNYNPTSFKTQAIKITGICSSNEKVIFKLILNVSY
jgi:hypothetical protein